MRTPTPGVCRSRIGLTAGLAALVALALSAGVATAAPPAPAACDDSDQGARIKCKLGNILAQQEATVAMLDSMSEIPEDQKQVLMNQCQRGRRALDRADAEDFKQLTKKKGAKCQVAEILDDGQGDDDGVCKGNEDCREVIGDGIGNDDGICSPRNGKKREACVEICDDEAFAVDPDNFDSDGRGVDFEQELDDVTDQYMKANEALEENMALRAAVRILAASDDPCAAVIKARTSTKTLRGWMYAKIALEMAADIADPFCNTDAGGFNIAFVCIAPNVVKAVAVGISDTLEAVDGDIDSDTLDSSFACLKQLNTSVGDNGQALESIETKVNQLDETLGDVQRKIQEVMDLLQTPQGRRPGFPQ